MTSVIKVNKSCDQCRHRKVRCIVSDASPGNPPTCIHCAKRGESCVFSAFRRKFRVPLPETLPTASQFQSQAALAETYIDRILQYGPQPAVIYDENRVIKAPDDQVSSSGLAFFSDQLVTSLTERIGTTRLHALVEKMEDIIVTRIGQSSESPWAPVHFRKFARSVKLPDEEARSYVQAYFAHLHPVYPFLDREEFEAQAYSHQLSTLVAQSPAFSALYHAILALGSQYFQEGAFQPGCGKAWELFQVSLGHMGELILPRESEYNLQALTAMSIFAMNTCCLSVDGALISQAAGMVQLLRYHKSSHSEETHLKMFWVIYALEKQQAFHSRSSSMIPDEDIGCLIPTVLESQFGEFNWFLSFIRLGRISSIAYTTLFSVSASLRSPGSYQIAIKEVRDLVESWRLSVPVEFRPGNSKQFTGISTPSRRLVALQTHFTYYHLIIALERLTLQVEETEGLERQSSMQRLMITARTVIELTRYVDTEPYVPIFILAVMPLAALFILFDFIIHNPTHRESRTNLSLLDTVAGYFSLLDIASKGALPGNVISEFADIAREYYSKAQQAPLLYSLQADKQTGGSAGEFGSNMPTNVAKNIDGANISILDYASVTGRHNPQESSAPIQDNTGFLLNDPAASDYLSYPTPSNLEAVTDIQMSDTADLRTMFGWVFPQEWDMGETAMGSLDIAGGISGFNEELR